MSHTAAGLIAIGGGLTVVATWWAAWCLLWQSRARRGRRAYDQRIAEATVRNQEIDAAADADLFEEVGRHLGLTEAQARRLADEYFALRGGRNAED